MILQTGKETKIFNLPRGYGKSTRMLYASEFTSIPILSMNKEYLKDLAQRYKIEIPEPISVNDYLKDRAKYPKVLVDEALLILKEFLGRTEIVGITLSDDENNNLSACWNDGALTGVEVRE